MIIKTLLAHKNLWLFFAALWTFTILFLCLVNSNELPSINLKIESSDKGVHFIFHFIFTLLWLAYLFAKSSFVTKSQIVKVILISVSFGCLIEIIQGSFTTTRNADIMDVLANSIGAISAGLLIYFILNRLNKLKT